MRIDGNMGCRNHWVTRYGLALAMGMVAVAVRWTLVPVIGHNVPYITIFPVIMFVSVMWGTGPGVLTTFVGLLLVEYQFMPPVGAIEWDFDFAIRATILVLTSTYVGWIAERLRRSREQAATDASAARASEEKYRLLFQNMAEGFALYELLYDEQGKPVDWRVLEVNDAYTRHTGLDRDQVVGRRMGELFPAARLEYLSRFAEVVSTQTSATFETYAEAVNRHHRVTSFPAGGSRFANIVEDITERKRSEDEVRKSSVELQAVNASLRDSRRAALNLMDDAVAARRQAEQASVELRRERDFIAGVLDNTGAMVVVLDPDGRITRFNRACEAITGYTSGDVLGRVFWDFLIPPEELRGVSETWTALRAGDFPNTHENHWMTRDKSRRLIAWSNTAIVRPDGGVEYIIGTGVDITERRKAEVALAESRKDLNRAQAVAHVGSWRLDVRKNELVWSDESWRIFGLPKVTPLTYETFLSTVHPDDRAYVNERWSAALRGEPYDIEHRIVVGDAIKWVQEKAELEFDDKGMLLGGFGTAQDITERRRFETQLAESEHRYRNLFTHMNEGFALHEILCDEQGEPVDYRFLNVNPAYVRMTGLLRDQLVGSRAREVTPGVQTSWIKKYGAVALTGTPCRFEDFNPDTGRWLEVYAYRPAEWQVAVILADITDMARAREREKDAMATMTAARTAMDTLEAMGEGLIVADRKGLVRSMNAAMVRLSGYDIGEVVGRSLAEILPRVVEREDLPASLKAIESALKGEIVAVPPLMLVAKDGRRIAVSPALSFICGPGGRTGGIVVTLRDISELRAAHRAVEDSERKYRELVESANSIIMRRRADGTITFFNEYAQKFFGFAAGEVLGRSVMDTIVPRVDSAGRDMAAVIREISADPDRHASNENENVRKDGRLAWIYWTNKAIRDEEGNVIEILCVGSDVTGRKLMEAENKRYQERLRSLTERLAASEEQDRWRISRYIHDTIVQNLSLSSIQLDSLAGSLARSGTTEENGKVGRTRRLIDQAIEECRMVMSDLTPAMLYELGLVAALNELAQRMEDKYSARVLIEDGGQEVPMGNSLRGMLFESTRELVMNAVKHAGECVVRVSLERQGRDIVVRVADDGKGFDSASADAAPGRHGGFGLFSVRQRVEGLGGRVDVVSAPGKGTAVTIRVPGGEAE